MRDGHKILYMKVIKMVQSLCWRLPVSWNKEHHSWGTKPLLMGKAKTGCPDTLALPERSTVIWFSHPAPFHSKLYPPQRSWKETPILTSTPTTPSLGWLEPTRAGRMWARTASCKLAINELRPRYPFPPEICLKQGKATSQGLAGPSWVGHMSPGPFVVPLITLAQMSIQQLLHPPSWGLVAHLRHCKAVDGSCSEELTTWIERVKKVEIN